MPANNAASPGVNGEPNAIGAAPAQTTEGASSPENVQGSEAPTQSRMSAVAQHLGLPPDVAKEIASREATSRETTPPGTAPAEAVADKADATPGAQETDHDEEHEDATDPASPFQDARVQKRLGKAKRQRERLETALEQAERERDEARAIADQYATALQPPPPTAPASRSALGMVRSEPELDRWLSEAQTAIAWCDENAEGASVGEGDKATFLEAAEIAKYRRQAEKVVLNAPQRRLEIRDSVSAERTQLEKFNEEAQAQYPWLFQPESKEYAEAQTLLRGNPVVQQALAEIPQFQNHPARNLLLGYLITGLKADLANGNRTTSLNPDLPESLIRKHPPLAPHTAGPPTRSAAPNAKTKVAEAMQHVVTQGGDRESLMAAIRARRASGSMGGTSGHALAAV